MSHFDLKITQKPLYSLPYPLADMTVIKDNVSVDVSVGLAVTVVSLMTQCVWFAGCSGAGVMSHAM